MRFAPHSPPGPCRGHPRFAPWRSSTNSNPIVVDRTAGAVGYIDFSGNMDTCIALRTMVIQGSRAYIQAGAGIVADSVPENEFQETMNKARGLLKAIEITEQRTADL